MTKTTNTLAAIAAGALIAAAAPAGAVQFGPSTPRGYVPGLSGASEFGLTDGNPGSLTCPACDSVVNFATYSNPARTDWTNAPTDPTAPGLGLNPTFLGGGRDTTSRWVFFYQIENTNPLGDPDSDLENFNVTVTDKSGDPYPVNLYTSGGYFMNSDLTPFSSNTDVIDTPNDWEPSEFGSREVQITGNDNEEPTSLLFTDAGAPNIIASAAVRAGAAAYAGALFDFGAMNLIGPGGKSEVLFLTSNHPWASLPWAETESPGGFGAAGDVAGVKAVIPVPAPLLLLPTAMAALGFAARRRRA